jgi:hypothetical protein
MKKKRFYVGVSFVGTPTVFRSATEPTNQNTGGHYSFVMGPFQTKRGADYYALTARNESHLRTVREIERGAKAHARVSAGAATELHTAARRRLALVPAERNRECDHFGHVRYSGIIPGTGPLRCTMCGERVEAFPYPQHPLAR